MRYAVILEKGKRNYSVYVPDLPGCVATGKTVQAALSAIRGAIELHIAGLVEDRQPVPDPTTLVDYVEVRIPTTAT